MLSEAGNMVETALDNQKGPLVCGEKSQPLIPDRLFHYTSLSTLALILENRRLRLSPLVSLDDPQEARSIDATGLARYTFVSCWTDDSEESIPMWNMYAGLDSGVRIEMDSDPFVRYTYTEEEFASAVGYLSSHVSFESGLFSCFLPAEDMRRCYSPAFYAGQGVLHRVVYTSDIELLEPQIISEDSDGLTAEIGRLGIYKNVHWSFQREWRYILQFLPFDTFGSMKTAIPRLRDAFKAMVDPQERALMNEYYLGLSDDAIRTMRIVLSPKMSPGNRLLAKALLEHHGLSECLRKSSLEGLL